MKNIDINVLKGLTYAEHKPFEKVNVVKVSKNGIVYIDDLAINRRHFIHIDKMKNLKSFFEEMNGLTDLYKGQFAKAINFHAFQDFEDLKLHYERAWAQY